MMNDLTTVNQGNEGAFGVIAEGPLKELDTTHTRHLRQRGKRIIIWRKIKILD